MHFSPRPHPASPGASSRIALLRPIGTLAALALASQLATSSITVVAGDTLYSLAAANGTTNSGAAAGATATLVPPTVTEGTAVWSADGEAALRKIPFFVRGKVKTNDAKALQDLRKLFNF